MWRIPPSTTAGPTTQLKQGHQTTCVQSHGKLSQLHTASLILISTYVNTTIANYFKQTTGSFNWFRTKLIKYLRPTDLLILKIKKDRQQGKLGFSIPEVHLHKLGEWRLLSWVTYVTSIRNVKTFI